MKYLLLLSSLIILGACSSGYNLEKELNDNPDIMVNFIKKHPEKVIGALTDAANELQRKQQKNKQQEEQKDLLYYFKNPLKPNIRKDETIRGNKNGSITIVKYSDFECPYCQRGFETVKAVMEKYPNEVRYIYKHLPLSFHPNAMMAAQYYEAIRLQDEEKSFKFHDNLFNNLSKVREGDSYFKKLAVELKVDLKKLEKELESEAVKNRIQEDMMEARKFKIQGTPGFVINGVPLKGAYPISHFEKIIQGTKR